MKALHLKQEISILKNNFLSQLKEYNLNVKMENTDQSFSHLNWIITLPFNYYYLFSDVDISLIRKLAIINALYGYYFMIEDDLLDEYHQPPKKYKLILTKYCAAQTVRNLAIGQMISLCGPDIYGYIYEYEYRYYRSIFIEKRGKPIPGSDISFAANLDFLGNKAIPAVTPFAAFCIVFNCEYKLDAYEQLIRKYHIAHQIYDDLMDFKQDVKRPDKSWLIRHIQEKMKRKITNPGHIVQFFRETNYDLELIDLIQSNLTEAKYLSLQLRFTHLTENISRLEKLSGNYVPKANMKA
jgi:hypothetical protein